MVDQQASTSSILTYATPLNGSTKAQPPKSVEVVRAERELNAIDELMADLTDEFVADAKRR